ncbi:MAG TPA: DNA polymerase III subunit delta [Acidobacteriota bacterium]|nr:DNA polymerase III subunit delta [Acidobacteriota bacterium]
MAFSLREDALLPAYLFYGEEDYLAEEFVDELRSVLAASSGGEVRLTRMDLDETKWREVVDAARTAPFLFEPWRAIVVRVPDKKAPERKSGGEGDEGRAPRFLCAADQKILKDYFADPPARTVLVVIRAGAVRRDDAFVRFFQSLPKSALSVIEMKRLSEFKLMQRADERARLQGKTLTEGARKRLFELVGQDLRLTMNEIDKLAIFVGEKKGIEEEDVNQATAGSRSFESYELDDALAAADFAKGAAVLGDLLAEGERPEQVVGRLTGFLRSVLAARTWLLEKGRTRDDIFQALFPYISKGWGDLYRRKSADFFGVVEALTSAELNALLAKLRRADTLLKTSDADPRMVLEVFLREFVLARKKKTIISPEGS